MIDLHNHLLPGVDDGVETVEEALFFGREAMQEQVTHIVCSPHYLDGRYDNSAENLSAPFSSLRKTFERQGLTIGLSISQEVHLCPAVIEAVNRKQILCLDSCNRYFQLEFPSDKIPSYAYQIVADLLLKGYQPIIVHPERNAGFIKEPNQLNEFLELGALAEVTAPSYLGVFGKKVQRVASHYIRSGMVQLMASDAHGEKRAFTLGEAYHKLIKKEGLEKVQNFQKNAERILQGEDVFLENNASKKRKWWFT